MLIRTSRGRLCIAASLLLALGTTSTSLSAAESILRRWPARTPTPQLKLTDLAGKEWSLEELSGKPVVLNFWASWCGPCVEELPVLNELAQRDNLVVLGVNYKEGSDAIVRFTREHPFRFPVLRDKTGAAFKQWSSGVMPTTVLIDRDGHARWRVTGELDINDAGFRQALESMLQQ
ncbi:TlpA family protein disulfide reductase [Massilia horti]|uniref:TlpA family protein disulfide reductase n=1 Tax=Massilia horti TaxID=2562153 RepID=A0A4Y9T0V9_9BURK|nr:TlpA disulfide reductase family protein [Massilia horti]TFW32843.1 TlpA family protein disulfide reductase [Massilia horti]